jgi:hypothetical protein
MVFTVHENNVVSFRGEKINPDNSRDNFYGSNPVYINETPEIVVEALLNTFNPAGYEILKEKS